MVKINRHLNVNLQVWRGNVFLFNIIILFFLSLLPIHVLAEEKVNNYPLGLKYEVFRDSTRGVTINEILSGKYNEEFIKSESKYPYFDYTNDAIWLKLEKEVIGEKFNEMTWLEYVDRLEVIDVYFVKSDYTYEVQKGGLYNLGEQKINFRSILFRFDPTDIEVIYIKLIGEELPVSVDTSLYSYEGLIESIKDYKFSSGFFYGFIGALAFYNLFLYFSLRERAYLYYIIYLIAFMLLQFLMNSLDVEYLSENLPVWFIVDAIDYASLLLCVTMVMFGQEFLETKKILPKLHLTLSIFSSLSLFTLLFFWVLPDSITNVIVPLLALIIPILLWISALRVMQMGNRMARLYLLGWTILLVSIILQALSYLDIIAFQAMYFDVIPQIAASIESLLLSLALADKINILKRQREEAQVLYTEQLVKEDKMKDDFLFRTSHELKTPLHGIINISQALIEDDDNRKEQLEKKLKLIKSAGYRMSNMVNDILDLAKIKEGLLTTQLSKVDLYLTVSNLFEMFRYIADGKNIKLVNKIDKANRFVIADEDRLIQVFYNLLNNSLKNTNAGSVTISNDVKGGHMYISVEDTGIGIAPHLHEKIFHSYESISTNNDLGNGGLGLGLSISRQLVQLMGGSLDVDWSKEKEGTRFIFSLPISRIESKVYEEVSSIRLPALGATIEEQTSMYSNDMASPMSDRLDILIVDDEVLNVEILKDILVRENYNLTVAFSGEEALERIQNKKPDLILLDVMLPGMSGYDVSKKVRDEYSLIDIPILFITVRNSVEDINTAFLNGGNDYVTKPFEADEIRARIRTLLTMKQMAEEATRNELAYLQSQIKPHFVFNSLNTIMYFCYKDSNKAVELLSIFTEYLRYIFQRNIRDENVTIQKEMDFVNVYIQLQKERFKEHFQFETDIDESLMTCEIPILSIQPLVENAINHGVMKKTEGGRITVKIFKDAENIMIETTDTGVGMSEKKITQILEDEYSTKGVGLLNIHKRIKKLTGSGLKIKSVENKYTSVSFSIIERKK